MRRQSVVHISHSYAVPVIKNVGSLATVVHHFQHILVFQDGLEFSHDAFIGDDVKEEDAFSSCDGYKAQVAISSEVLAL